MNSNANKQHFSKGNVNQLITFYFFLALRIFPISRGFGFKMTEEEVSKLAPSNDQKMP